MSDKTPPFPASLFGMLDPKLRDTFKMKMAPIKDDMELYVVNEQLKKEGKPTFATCEEFNKAHGLTP